MEPFMFRFSCGLAAVLLLCIRVAAQTDAATAITISTDRPAVSSSSVVVPQGGFQAENGLLVTNTEDHTVVDFPESNFRYGLLGKTELRLSAPDYFYNLPSGSATTSGFGDVALGVKQQIGPFGGFDLSAIVFVSFPTGASRVSSHGYDPGLQFPWTYKLSPNWAAGGQVAFYWPTLAREHNFTEETALFVDRQLTKSWDTFVEYAGDFPQSGGSRQLLHMGTAYKLTPHQQLDFHVAVGISNAAPHSYVGVGYSILFLAARR
jgi:Putative MetA-pathway of phenol degradation